MITGPITKFNRKYLKRLRPLSGCRQSSLTGRSFVYSLRASIDALFYDQNSIILIEI